MNDFLAQLKTAPDYLRTPESRRAYAFNRGFRRLAESEMSSGTYAVWLMNRATHFVSREDYPIVACDCHHVEILDESQFRGAPVFWCPECNHLVRFGFTGIPIHCESGR